MTAATETAAPPDRLARGLGPVEATTLVVGGIIGSGIFLSPSIVAREVGTPGLSLLVWVLAGVLATCGALCYAELGAMIPETGGTYAFLRRGYRNPLVAFLFGWMFFFVDATGAIAAVATAFASYAGYFLGQWVPYGPAGVKLVAVLAIALLTAVNYVGVRAGGRTQNVLTVLKVGLLGAIVVLAFTAGDGSMRHVVPLLPEHPGLGTWAAVGTAMIPTLFAYSGWTFSTYVAGEVRDPQRNVPRSILIGMAIVLAVYLAANLAYMYVLPFDRLRASTLVATDAMREVVGPWGTALVAAAVMVSTLGALNAAVLGYPRIVFAMARDGKFFPGVDRIHPRHRTPGNAILMQGGLACAFALSGSYERILSYFAFVDYLFFALAVVVVFRLRRSAPELPRPYRVWGYPLTPVLFLAISSVYLGTVLVQRFAESMVGVLLMLSGIPFYLYWRRPGGRRPSSPGAGSH